MGCYLERPGQNDEEIVNRRDAKCCSHQSQIPLHERACFSSVEELCSNCTCKSAPWAWRCPRLFYRQFAISDGAFAKWDSWLKWDSKDLAIPGLDAGIQQNLKRAVAKKAVELVKSGMIVGLGTGSTSSMAIEELGKLIAQNKVQSTQFYSFLVAYKILPQLDLLGNIAWIRKFSRFCGDWGWGKSSSSNRVLFQECYKQGLNLE